MQNISFYGGKILISPCRYLGDNCIQNFLLGRYIIGYTVGNLVLWRRMSRAVKHDFGLYIRQYTATN